ncbi:MAG: Holliday junction branch migration protein RuvA, partial [Planctomycetota bacterium]
MITRMTGTINRILDDEARVQVGPIEYQVLIPELTRRELQSRVGDQVNLGIIEYLEGNQSGSRLVPRKIGFLSDNEMEFFELFCTVDKIGPKKALNAMSAPIAEIAKAIISEDHAWLTSLNGIGKASAESIVGKLKNKVAKFLNLLPAGQAINLRTSVSSELFDQAFLGMLALGLSAVEARNRLESVIRNGKQ